MVKLRWEGDMQRDVWYWLRARSKPPPGCLWPLWRSVSTLTEPFRPDGIILCWCMSTGEVNLGVLDVCMEPLDKWSFCWWPTGKYLLKVQTLLPSSIWCHSQSHSNLVSVSGGTQASLTVVEKSSHTMPALSSTGTFWLAQIAARSQHESNAMAMQLLVIIIAQLSAKLKSRASVSDGSV